MKRENRQRREQSKDEQAKKDRYWDKIEAVKEAEEVLRDHFAAKQEKEYIMTQIKTR